MTSFTIDPRIIQLQSALNELSSLSPNQSDFQYSFCAISIEEAPTSSALIKLNRVAIYSPQSFPQRKTGWIESGCFSVYTTDKINVWLPTFVLCHFELELSTNSRCRDIWNTKQFSNDKHDTFYARWVESRFRRSQSVIESCSTIRRKTSAEFNQKQAINVQLTNLSRGKNLSRALGMTSSRRKRKQPRHMNW